MPEASPSAAHRHIVEEWLNRTEGPAFGEVSQVSGLQVRADGAVSAGFGHVLADLATGYRTVVCLFDTRAATLKTLDIEPTSLAWVGQRLAVGHDGGLTLLDGEGCVEREVPIQGQVQNIVGSPSGSSALILAAPVQHGNFDAAPAVVADPRRSAPLVYEGAPEIPRVLTVVDALTGNRRPLTLGPRNVWEADWIDEERLAVVVSDTPGETGWYTPYLAAVGTRDGALTERYRPRNDRQLAWPVARGECLYVVEGAASDRGVLAGDVVAVQPDGAVSRVDTGGTDVTCLTAAGEGLGFVGLRGLRTIAGLVEDGSHRHIEYPIGDCTMGGARGPEGSFDTAGNLHGLMESFTRYPRIVTVDRDRVNIVYDLHHPGADAYLSHAPSVHEVTWSAPDGLEIEGILVTPPGDGPFPLLLNVHGGPVAAWRNRWGVANSNRHPYVGLLTEQGYASLYPNPRGSQGRGQAFIDRVRGDMVGADVADLLSGLEHLAAMGIVDEQRIAVTGNSYGGQMSAWLAVQSDRFAAVIATSPCVDFVSQHYTSDIPDFDRLFLRDDIDAPDSEYRRRSPIHHVQGTRTPTLITGGMMDKTTPPEQAVAFHQALRRQGAPTTLVLYPQQGHGIAGFPDSTDYIARLLEWLDRYVAVSRSTSVAERR